MGISHRLFLGVEKAAVEGWTTLEGPRGMRFVRECKVLYDLDKIYLSIIAQNKSCAVSVHRGI